MFLNRWLHSISACTWSQKAWVNSSTVEIRYRRSDACCAYQQQGYRRRIRITPLPGGIAGCACFWNPSYGNFSHFFKKHKSGRTQNWNTLVRPKHKRIARKPLCTTALPTRLWPPQCRPRKYESVEVAMQVTLQYSWSKSSSFILPI